MVGRWNCLLKWSHFRGCVNLRGRKLKKTAINIVNSRPDKSMYAEFLLHLSKKRFHNFSINVIYLMLFEKHWRVCNEGCYCSNLRGISGICHYRDPFSKRSRRRFRLEGLKNSFLPMSKPSVVLSAFSLLHPAIISDTHFICQRNMWLKLRTKQNGGLKEGQKKLQ